MRKLTQEPLFHFLLLGAAIFFIYLLAQRDAVADQQIIINDTDVEHISALYESQWHRPPTSEELIGLISDKIRQEVFYREALNLNLEKNDEIVKQHLAEKMQFLSNDLSKLTEIATDEQLEAYFEKNRDRYLLPSSFNFYQIVLTPERHTNTRETAENLLRTYPNAKPEEMKNLGDPSSLPFSIVNKSVAEIKNNLGIDLADSIGKWPLNKWVGPIKSGFGWHLLYITEEIPPHNPTFAEAKNEVKRDYQNNQEAESKSEVYRGLEKNYEIEIKANALTADQHKAIYEKLKGPI